MIEIADLPPPLHCHPEDGDEYYSIDAVGEVYCCDWYGKDSYDKKLFEDGNVFRSREDAERWADFERKTRVQHRRK